jgi:flagellum-specific peptidoglycan hydrolase FlgJ
MTDPRLQPYISPAIASHAKFRPRGPFVSITLVQGIIESAWFTRVAGRNNFFGIKASATQIRLGMATKVMTHEFIHGANEYLAQYFANYPTIESGFDAHATLLCTSHYLQCQLATNPHEYAEALQTCGYATAPNYSTSLIEIMDRYDLYQYDK